MRLASSPLVGSAQSQTQAIAISIKHHGLPNPNSKMPPLIIDNGGDDMNDDTRHDVSEVKVQQQSGVSPSALVSAAPTIASVALEGQLSSGFHPSALAS